MSERVDAYAAVGTEEKDQAMRSASNFKNTGVSSDWLEFLELAPYLPGIDVVGRACNHVPCRRTVAPCLFETQACARVHAALAGTVFREGKSFSCQTHC